LREGELVDITVTRDIIQVPTIDQQYNAQTGIYTISLYSFTANSGQLFNKALGEFRRSGATKLIIDLRGNPGGYLDAAVSMASHFLPKGTAVVTEDYRGKRQNVVHESSGIGGVPSGTKVVILIDQGSASASEILAGALQDEEIATLVGTRSFGKGSVQELVEIGGGSLKVTVARWLTPAGRSISDGGLTADFYVERTRDDVLAGKDPQMERAVQFLTTGK
jgi:carboxyl-terminal processing protease